ncbi:hypothetical protein CTEN210_09561 [Chaetoceros tenuissimus]|uniref:Uncharacterized protein n=1 Tax=Chaetoceros tenuissimus TaxID=426638 RepID=A0AAD3CY24_9STRA|nr:hypothetical protein CTEN210_09561 [Chaetoceros tenuissimus]
MSAPRFANALKKLPVPLFGTAATAVQFGAKKATSAPRYAQWGVPLAAGGLWFVWPAVDEEWKQSLFQFGSSSHGEVVAKAEDKKDVDEVSDSTQVEDEATNITESTNDAKNSPTADKEVVAATEESAETVSSNEEESSVIDKYENLPEEDEPTTCTICLINRQGPCRPMWRKFERCMKDNSNSDDNSDSVSPSMSEKCDAYMLPWIKCIQSYRNRYTIIANNFFQKELIAEVEKEIKEEEKVLLEGFDVSSIIQVGHEWNDIDKTPGKELADDEDATLVEGVAKINLWDNKGSRPIEIAYVKDQDGNLLGYDQFFDFKKSIKDDKENSAKVGVCNFHVSGSTQSIQIFALYRDMKKEDSTDAKSDDKDKVAPEERAQKLFYSKSLSMETIPVQMKEEEDDSSKASENIQTDSSTNE